MNINVLFYQQLNTMIETMHYYSSLLLLLLLLLLLFLVRIMSIVGISISTKSVMSIGETSLLEQGRVSLRRSHLAVIVKRLSGGEEAVGVGFPLQHDL